MVPRRDLCGQLIHAFNDEAITSIPQNVRIIDLSDNPIKSWAYGHALPFHLEALLLERTYITGFDEGVGSLPLYIKRLWLAMNRIASFEGCEALPPGLEKICLERCHFRSFEGCAALPRGLKNLCLCHNVFSSFKGCEGLPRGLETLCLIGNDIQSLEGCEGLPRGVNLIGLKPVLRQIISRR